MQAYVDPLPKSAAFEQLTELFETRIAYIDGAMGTSIQQYKCDSHLYEQAHMYFHPATQEYR